MRQVNDLSYIARDSLTSVKATTAAGALAQLGEAEKILDVALTCHASEADHEEAHRKLRRLRAVLIMAGFPQRQAAPNSY